MYILTPRDRELIGIIRTLKEQGSDASYSEILENIQGFRAGSYVLKMLRRLKNEGYITKTDKGYDVPEEPQLTEEELTEIDEKEFLSLAEASQCAGLVLGIAKYRQKDLKELRRAILKEVSSDTIKENFLFWVILFNLSKSTNLVPRITVRPTMQIEFGDALIDLFNRLPDRTKPPVSVESMAADMLKSQKEEDNNWHFMGTYFGRMDKDGFVRKDGNGPANKELRIELQKKYYDQYQMDYPKEFM